MVKKNMFHSVHIRGPPRWQGSARKSGPKLTQMAFGGGMKSAALVWWENEKKKVKFAMIIGFDCML